MKYILLSLILIVSFSTTLFAQTDNTGPVVWELYRHSDLDVSLNLPKMPTVIASHDPCTEELRRSAYAYAEGAVYEFTVVARVAPKVRPRHCSMNKWVLDQSTIDRRLDDLRQDKGVSETKITLANLASYRFDKERSIRVIVPDIVNQRLVELAITHYPKEPPPTDRFLKSLQFDAVAGIEIGEGAKVTLGDPVGDVRTCCISDSPVSNEKGDPSAGKQSSDRTAAEKGPIVLTVAPFVIVAKPIARYTDAARSNNVQGSVRLKATLLANGAVGTVTPTTTLEHGLTEQAIAAARRIVFVPARVNGIAVSKTITIDYAFSIY